MQLTSKKLPKKSNPMAKEVRTPKYRQRKVKDKTIYNRKEEKEWTPTKGLLKMLVS